MIDIIVLIEAIHRHAARCEALTTFADRRIAARSAAELEEMRAVLDILEAAKAWSEDIEQGAAGERPAARRLFQAVRSSRPRLASLALMGEDGFADCDPGRRFN
jgi:hypothetical protein